MKEKSENQKQQESLPKASKAQSALWLLILVLIAAGVFANYYFGSVAWPIRVAGWIVLACVILFVAYQTEVGKKVWVFAKEARVELYKVVWPTRKEATHMTLLLSALVLVIAIILWGMDSFLLWAINLLIT